MSIFTTSFVPKSVLAGASLIAALALVAFTGVGQAHADRDPGDAEFLDTAEDFAIIAAAQITETTTFVSRVDGDVAVSTGTAQGLLPTQVVGFIYTGTDAEGATALQDASDAFDTLAAADVTPVVGEITADLAGGLFLAGVYHSDSQLELSGNMTVHGVTADDVFIFQAGSALIVNVGSTVTLSGLAQACNVYWVVGSSATIGVGADFVGTVIARTTITAATGADIEGRLFALTGEVTLDENDIDSQTRCVRTAVVGPVTTTTTRLDGEVTVVVVDSTPTDTTPTDTTPTDTTRTGTGRPTGLLYTGPLSSTGVDHTGSDVTMPILAAGLLGLLGLALIAVPRVLAGRKNN